MLSNQEQVYQIDDVSNQPFEILWQNLKKIFDHKGKFIVNQMVCKLNFGVYVRCVWLSLSLNHTDLILPINVVFGYQANLSNEYAGCLSVWHARNISLYVCVSMLIPCEECESIHFECSPSRCHLIRAHTHTYEISHARIDEPKSKTSDIIDCIPCAMCFMRSI